MIPWRIKNFISERFPLAYHLIANAGFRGNSPEHWDKALAESWDAANRSWPAKVAAIANTLPPTTRLLDVGCGTGSILRSLRDLGFTDLQGLELSSYAVERLRNEGFCVTKGSVLRLPFHDNSFDAVIASEVLEHVIRRRKFLQELRRVLLPGGMALVFVPDNCLGPIDEPEHVTKYDKNSLYAILSKFFSVESIYSITEAHNEAPSLLAVCRKWA